VLGSKLLTTRASTVPTEYYLDAPLLPSSLLPSVPGPPRRATRGLPLCPYSGGGGRVMNVVCAQCGSEFRTYPSWHRRKDGVILCSLMCRSVYAATFRAPFTIKSWDDERFWPKVERSDGCWQWVGHKTPRGYGIIRIAGSTELAHRIAYALSEGGIPANLDVHHLCHNPGCVNPSHMVLMTTGDHFKLSLPAIHQKARDGHLLHPFCKRGHPMSGDNLSLRANGTRRCKACVARSSRKLWRRKFGSAAIRGGFND
jgi:hypothetical protein